VLHTLEEVSFISITVSSNVHSSLFVERGREREVERERAVLALRFMKKGSKEGRKEKNPLPLFCCLMNQSSEKRREEGREGNEGRKEGKGMKEGRE
jgi:hypothetical protein